MISDKPPLSREHTVLLKIKCPWLLSLLIYGDTISSPYKMALLHAIIRLKGHNASGLLLRGHREEFTIFKSIAHTTLEAYQIGKISLGWTKVLPSSLIGSTFSNTENLAEPGQLEHLFRRIVFSNSLLFVFTIAFRGKRME